MPFLRDREIRVRVARTGTNTDDTPPTETTASTFETIEEIISRNAKALALGCVAIYAAVRVIDATCEIAVNAAPKNH